MPLTIPSYLEIRTAAGATAAFLSPEADGLKECFIDNELNGSCTLTFSLPTTSDKKQYLTEAYRIYAPDSTGTMKEFVILTPDSIERVRDGKKVMGKITAQESWVRLGKDYIDPGISNDPQTPSPPALAVIVLSGGSDLSGGLYTVGSAAHALYAVLQGTGWTVGTADQTGTHDLETEKISVLANIQKIQEIWGGYLVWDSVNKIVSLRDETAWAEYTGYQIRYAKNLKGITRTSDFDIVTKLYPFGADDLNIGSVNGGVIYLTNNTYTAEELKGIWENQDIADATELKTEATKYLAKVCRPRHNYRIDQVDLRTLSGYQHENFDVGHMVDIIDADLDTDDQARIIRHRFNVFQPWICELEVGDPLDTDAKLIADSQITVKYLNAIKNSKGQITAYKLVDESIIREKIAAAAVDASKLNTKTVILFQDEWTDNSPAGGSVAWNQHKLYYAGVEYIIQAGNTAQKYVYWDGVANTYSVSADMPTLTDGQFVIAMNNGGLHDTVWDKGYAREFIGSVLIAQAAILSAHIAELQVLSSHIANLDANKINVTDLTALSSGDGFSKMMGDGFRVYDETGNLLGHMGRYDGIGDTPGTFTRASTAYKQDGTQVASGVPRYEAGQFGQGLFLERQTTNLLGTDGNFETDSNSDGVPDGWEFYNSPAYLSLATDKKWAGSKSVKVNCDNTGGGSQLVPAGRSTPRSATVGQIHTASCKVYIESASIVGTPAIRLWLRFDDDAGNLIGQVSAAADNTKTDQWQTISVSMEMPSGATKVKVLGPYATVPAGSRVVCWYDAFIVEQYVHKTSYCDNTRQGDQLYIPTSGVIDSTKGTIELFYEVTDDTQVAGMGAKYLFSHATSNIAGPGGTYPNAIALYINETSVRAYTSNANGDITSVNYITELVNGLHRFAISWDSTELALFVDGQKVVYANNPNLPQSLADYLYIGGWAYSTGFAVCGVIDDLRISDIKRTDQDIADAFASGLPLPIDADTTWKMGFEETLYPTVKKHGFFTKNGRIIIVDPLSGEGIEVWDGTTRKVLIGRLDDGTIGQEIVGGRLYSSSFRTGSKTDTTYIALEGSTFRAKVNNNVILEIEAGVDDGNLYFSKAADGAAFGRILRYTDLYPGMAIESVGTGLSLRSAGNIDALLGSGSNKFTVHGDFHNTGTLTSYNKLCYETTSQGVIGLFTRESPDVRYIDEGRAELVNGECRVDLDPTFLECIIPDSDETPWDIYLTPKGPFTIYEAEIGDSYFIIKSHEPDINGKFTWKVSATRKNKAGVRFPRMEGLVGGDEENDPVLVSNWEDELLSGV